MAQTQVVITGVDRTKAAMDSVARNMKSIERTAKTTAKAVNLAFGLLSGTILVSAFGKIAEAAKKTEEGRRSLDRFNQALKDPALVSAANAFTTTLINGFTNVLEFAADATRAITQVGRDLGVFAQPVDKSQLGKGEGGRRGRRPDVDPIKAMENEWKFRMKSAETEKKWSEEAEKARMKAITAEAAHTKMMQEFNEELRKTPELFEMAFSATDVTIASSVQNILDQMELADSIMQTFAQQAAGNIQSAFADFLFDPFENGLKGMVKGFIDAIRRMIAELMASYLLRQFFQYMSGFGGFAGTVGTAAVKALTGRAMGGPVSSGTPYMVGERGPELFVPGASGTIVPNHAMGGVTVSPVYNIDARGATADLQKALPGILNENNRRIFDELDRRYGIGR